MRKLFTPEEDAFILANYLTIPMKRIAKMLGRADNTARQRLHTLGYRVPQEVADRFARESRLKKGHTPPNKGKKMSQQQREKCSKTWFQKGHLPHNTLHDGAIRPRMDEHSPYLYVRLAKRKWELLHRVVWEQHYGKIPEGMMVTFKDGNTKNCAIENLMLTTREETMKKNSIHNLPAEVKNTIRVLQGYKRKLNTHEKKHQRPAGNSL